MSRAEAYKNYLKTMRNPIPISLLYEKLPREIVDSLRDATGDNIHAWGATRKGRLPNIWSKMQPGDYVLTYRKRVFICLSRILYKVHNEELAEQLWGRGKNPDNLGLTWEYIYFLEKIKDNLAIPSKYVFRGHTGPLEGTTEKEIRKVILDILKDIDPDYEKSDDDLEHEINDLINAGNFRVEDNWGTRKIRKAQKVWRELVINNFNGRCAVCGINIRELLDAAHIRSWSEDPDNRMNPLNGIALCVLHHRAFDRKIIQIDDKGKIICDEKLLTDANNTVEQFIAQYHNKRILPPRAGKLLGIDLN